MKLTRWCCGLALAATLAGCGVRDGGTPSADASSPSAEQSWDLQPINGDYDPADHAESVVTHCASADVDPVLLMAVLYNEAYKPHDPEQERKWHEYDPDSGFGIANMHEDAFNDVKQGRDFADRKWDELPDDPDLAVQAAAWYLHDLASQLPSDWPADYSTEDLLALGYNAGPGNMLAYADGGEPDDSVRNYLDDTHENWDKAEKAINEVS